MLLVQTERHSSPLVMSKASCNGILEPKQSGPKCVNWTEPAIRYFLEFTSAVHDGFVIPAKAGIQRLAVRLPCVYILASRRNGTLYVGVTADLVQRVWQHKSDLTEGFTKRYGVHTLVWYEVHESMESAIRREKAIKEWKRAWKLELIEKE